MTILSEKDWKLKNIKKSTVKNKKYDAFFVNKENGKIKKLSFGDKRYMHYRDSTPLKIYKHLDHNDRKRRMNFKKRHSENINKGKYNSAWLANKYLW